MVRVSLTTIDKYKSRTAGGSLLDALRVGMVNGVVRAHIHSETNTEREALTLATRQSYLYSARGEQRCVWLVLHKCSPEVFVNVSLFSPP